LSTVSSNRRFWILGLFLLALSGCAVGQTLQGKYFLNMEEYDKGIRTFSQRLIENPEDPEANYYMGRLLLAKEQPKKALPHLQKAAALKPNVAEYHFWTGVGHWALGQSDKERASYLKALELNSRYVPAHVYIGHTYQDRGDLDKAMEHYRSALRFEPSNPEALYHRAMVLQKQGKATEEAKAWKSYLDEHPDGPLAQNASRYLNARGDFSYRPHQVGHKSLVLAWIRFIKGTDVLHSQAEPSLHVVGKAMEKVPSTTLTVQSFARDDLDLAKRRGDRVKEFLVRRYGLDPSRIVVEPYGRPENVMAGGTVYALDHSIVFKTRDQQSLKQ
jgi:tetratricopeptide (TPR) repeat protein